MRFASVVIVLSLAAGVSGLVAALSAADTKRGDKDAKFDKVRVYVGTYTGKDSKGIYRFDFDLATGKLSNKELAAEVKRPSFLAIHPKRQEGPHSHSVNVDANNQFAVVADLGLDKLFVYHFDPKKGTLTPNDPPAYETEPGAGPRHFAFHADGKHAYVINELACTVSALDYDADKGVLKREQTVSTLPKGTQKE